MSNGEFVRRGDGHQRRRRRDQGNAITTTTTTRPIPTPPTPAPQAAITPPAHTPTTAPVPRLTLSLTQFSSPPQGSPLHRLQSHLGSQERIQTLAIQSAPCSRTPSERQSSSVAAQISLQGIGWAEVKQGKSLPYASSFSPLLSQSHPSPSHPFFSNVFLSLSPRTHILLDTI